MKKIRILPTVLFNDFSIVKGENFESWRIVGNLVQIVKIYSLREENHFSLAVYFVREVAKRA